MSLAVLQMARMKLKAHVLCYRKVLPKGPRQAVISVQQRWHRAKVPARAPAAISWHILLRCQVSLINKSSLLKYLPVPADWKARAWPLLYMRFHALVATTSASFTA